MLGLYRLDATPPRAPETGSGNGGASPVYGQAVINSPQQQQPSEVNISYQGWKVTERNGQLSIYDPNGNAVTNFPRSEATRRIGNYYNNLAGTSNPLTLPKDVPDAVVRQLLAQVTQMQTPATQYWY